MAAEIKKVGRNMNSDDDGDQKQTMKMTLAFNNISIAIMSHLITTAAKAHQVHLHGTNMPGRRNTHLNTCHPQS